MHLESKMEAYVQCEWGYDIYMYMSTLLSNRRGILTLINNTFEYDIGQVKKDPNGNFLITKLTICGKKVTLVNIYGPNKDSHQFYTNIQQHVFEIGNENVIFCGDWNFILNPILDSENYRNINNPRARDAIIKIIEENGYIDVWRVQNENKKKFTWRRLNPDKKQSKLDFVSCQRRHCPVSTRKWYCSRI